MASLAEAAGVDFWHTNLADVPKLAGSFIEIFSRENLPIKATLSQGYKFFHESYIHSSEGLCFFYCRFCYVSWKDAIIEKVF